MISCRIPNGALCGTYLHPPPPPRAPPLHKDAESQENDSQTGAPQRRSDGGPHLDKAVPTRGNLKERSAKNGLQFLDKAVLVQGGGYNLILF